MTFEERIKDAPYFAKKFIEQVKQKINSLDNAWIGYTNTNGGDMRIRKGIDTKLGFVNVATISWQPINNRFLLATCLTLGDCQFSALTVDYRVRPDSLPLVIFLDETIINQKTDNILDYIKYAHKKHENKKLSGK